MTNPFAAIGVAPVVALGLALAGCGSDTASETATTTTTETTTETEAETPTTSAQASGPNYTIADYIRDNDIVETPVQRGDPGAPTVDLPVPPDWEDAGPRTPEGAWSAIISTDPAMADDPPTIVALMSRLTGDVDPAKILEYAPGELQNLPGFEGEGSGASTLGGFEAREAGGTYVRDGAKRAIAQKTVVIPGQDGLYVLRLKADALEDQSFELIFAVAAIDDETTITP
ncbi:LpqN/LpqT family lipoprotein [Mycobacterium sp. Y57]|uniref:LpqN/LpqT family lipoprotein n=1 Tax=Mycolicibacterium xanthum TaxID=2796469 RepID=UPI001C858869|nr:LpqN/LpqT family lipoprotein [Mycolicibacterium xanthum]MBX7435598.1 LpqN/LpqT family lipoprotein [Mycolicibacterium xanthum]